MYTNSTVKLRTFVPSAPVVYICTLGADGVITLRVLVVNMP